MPHVSQRPLQRAFAVLFFCVAAPALWAQQPSGVPRLDVESALQASREAVGRTVGEHALLDREGRPVRLSDYRGKPLVVSFIYTGCFEVCPTTTRALLKSVAVAEEALGADKFNVVSIGFNQPFDSPQALKSYAAQHGVRRPNWEFLSPAKPTVDELTRDFGFRYVATPAGFDHVLQVSIVDAQGRIVRQVYGDAFGADMLVDPLKQLITGAPLPEGSGIAGVIDRVRILCTVYDSASGKYRYNYALLLEIAGGLTFLIVVAVWAFREWRRARAAMGA